MATVVTRPSATTQSSSLSLNTSVRGTPAAIPNKHLPTCSPGPRPSGHRLSSPVTPSPSSPPQLIETSSLLHPPDRYSKISARPSIYALGADQLSAALDHAASQLLPDPSHVFPWLHGLHSDNALQLAFFIARKKTLRRTPRCIRSITLVKAGGDLSCSKIKGAIAPEELLCSIKLSDDPEFIDADPKDGFSVRNFQIQAAKMATVSDIIVYGDDKTSKHQVMQLAERIARAQKAWRNRDVEAGADRPKFSTFVVTDPFSKIEQKHPHIVAIGSDSCLTGNVLDFFHAERLEMHAMSAASEIAKNIWLGPTPEPANCDVENAIPYDFLIECNELAQIPTSNAFAVLERLANSEDHKDSVPQLEFPGSGSIMPPTWSQAEADGLLSTIIWIHQQANGLASAEAARKRKDSRIAMTMLDRDSDGDSIMESAPYASTKKFLFHCSDGYTETTLLAISYYMYANCVPLHQAYIELHKQHKRNFFAYPTDVALLTSIQPRLLQASPACRGLGLCELSPPTPAWLRKIDGSIPSRITDYMYLGNLNHANNPGLLRELGIGQILSVGETLEWSEDDKHNFCNKGEPWECEGDTPRGRWMYVGGVQDNGVDPLTEDFSKCLEFIRKGKAEGRATLVHCRVGVSRSATICIAQVMNEMGLSFPRAYCFVRARRLNVIIQPHLRFSYELLKYEELQAAKSGRQFRRDLEWATIAREIAAMNRPYSRQ